MASSVIAVISSGEIPNRLPSDTPSVSALRAGPMQAFRVAPKLERTKTLTHVGAGGRGFLALSLRGFARVTTTRQGVSVPHVAETAGPAPHPILTQRLQRHKRGAQTSTPLSLRRPVRMLWRSEGAKQALPPWPPRGTASPAPPPKDRTCGALSPASYPGSGRSDARGRIRVAGPSIEPPKQG